MIALGVLLGGMAAVAVVLIVIIMRRGNRRTENADGLLLEQRRREQAWHDRQVFNSRSVHNAPPNMSDSYRNHP
ncbi:hypothetical protein ACIQNU_20985 [Streptomyces sp. NPDC091292]|uniref:hypothetical protein n=1 Tax=Streptomyces sp. NPDC091292 TaxID=3365991 RepID=UPI00380B1369